MTLLVGFDSAWTQSKQGAIVGVLHDGAGTFHELDTPKAVDYAAAEATVDTWQRDHNPSHTLILLDQPTIVPNRTGQRRVENIVCAAVSRRRGGMQPANTGRAAMFGPTAPIWTFLGRFGGAAVLPDFARPINVIETYPVLTMVSLGWMLADPRPLGRLPKYNPAKRKNFNLGDWAHVCRKTSAVLRRDGLVKIPRWLDDLATLERPQKHHQDGIDACLCLLVALHLANGRNCLLIGDQQSGYIVVPDSFELRAELEERCFDKPQAWMQIITCSGIAVARARSSVDEIVEQAGLERL